MQQTFKALVLTEHDGAVDAGIRELAADELPEGDVLVHVAYSSLNYKDGLAVTGTARVVRSYPMVPGIDLAGTVVESSSPTYQPGDKVIGTGWEMGERRWGGYTQYQRVQSEHLVSLPPSMSLQDAMGIGTAGFTAMLAVIALERHGLQRDGGEIVVTGATGGVGSLAIAILASLGYKTVASTGSAEAHDYLRELGAGEIIDREVLAGPSNKPLERERWAGAVDAVGGETLAGLLRATARDGAIAACGNAGGVALNTTVLPFILRGVALLGIDSNLCPYERRKEAWERLAYVLPIHILHKMMTVVPLEDIPKVSKEILQGKIQGRVVVSAE
jgi:acrylyl-CoA reductase (NADPH)